MTATKKQRQLLLFSSGKPMLFAILIALLIFGWAVNLVFIQHNSSFDSAVFKAITPYESPVRTNIIVVISFLGKHSFLVPVNFLLLSYFLYKKKKDWAIRIAFLGLSAFCLKLLFKALFNRPRPIYPLIEPVKGLSFPSGHALLGVTFYGFIALILWYEIKNRTYRNIITAFLILLILAIAFSRVYLRVNYMSDVIAGLAVGFIWLVLSLWVVEKLETRHRSR